MSQAAFTLCGLASVVVQAEGTVDTLITRLRNHADRAERSLTSGSGLNSLGELQSTGPAFDVAVANLESAAKAFKTAWAYLADEFDDPANPEATTAALRERLDYEVRRSPRLQAMTANPSKR